MPTYGHLEANLETTAQAKGILVGLERICGEQSSGMLRCWAEKDSSSTEKNTADYRSVLLLIGSGAVVTHVLNSLFLLHWIQKLAEPCYVYQEVDILT